MQDEKAMCQPASDPAVSGDQIPALNGQTVNLQGLLQQICGPLWDLMAPGQSVMVRFHVDPVVLLPGQRPAVRELVIFKPSVSSKLEGKLR